MSHLKASAELNWTHFTHFHSKLQTKFDMFTKAVVYSAVNSSSMQDCLFDEVTPEEEIWIFCWRVAVKLDPEQPITSSC